MPVLPSYRNQSIDLLCKSIDWFLYEGNTGIYWVNQQSLPVIESTASEILSFTFLVDIMEFS